MNLTTTAFIRLLSRPVVLIYTIFVIYVALNVKANEKNNVITKFAAKLSESAALKPLGDWLNKHVIQFTGFIIYLVPVFYFRRSQALMILGAFTLTAYVEKAQAILDYVIQAAFLYLFIAVRNIQYKFFLIVIGFLLYYMGVGFSNLFGTPGQ